MGINNNISIIISCAGMGTRLGIGTTKALVDIDGKPLIIRQLEMLNDFNDIRVVVGYQAEKVIDVVRAYRQDVIFAYNYDYKTTGTAASFSKGIVDGKDYVVAFDGDLLVHPDDLNVFLNYEGSVVGGCIPTTDNPVLMSIEDGSVIDFSREKGSLEWTGLAKLERSRLTPGTGHVYQMIEPLMPIKVMEIRTKEIDTPHDYENAVRWVRNGYCEISG